jgi:hypothetical protein
MLSRLEEFRQRARRSEEMAQETTDVAKRNRFLDLVEQSRYSASDAELLDRKRGLSAIISIPDSPVTFRWALYERTYRVLCDAGIEVKLADELATQRVLAAAILKITGLPCGH